MTFDLTPEQDARLQALRQTAASTLAPVASLIDTSGQISTDVIQAVDQLGVWSGSALDAVLAIEELATVSASVAARAALGADSPATGLAGLRGVGPVTEPSDSQQLGMAAVCLGLGRAALHEALETTRARGDRPSGDAGDAPHWALADAATDMEAARLLVRSAAQGLGVGAPAALVYAGGAASRAVDTALRLVGAGAYQPGSVLERCSRDIRAALLIVGTEDVARRLAADTLLG
jgi:alkylation response protein AidB-like acyl-CoA dehydrogenase